MKRAQTFDKLTKLLGNELIRQKWESVNLILNLLSKSHNLVSRHRLPDTKHCVSHRFRKRNQSLVLFRFTFNNFAYATLAVKIKMNVVKGTLRWQIPWQITSVCLCWDDSFVIWFMFCKFSFALRKPLLDHHWNIDINIKLIVLVFNGHCVDDQMAIFSLLYKYQVIILGRKLLLQ